MDSSKATHIMMDARIVKGRTPLSNVYPMQRVNNHLLVAVLMDDVRKGIEYQMDPSSFSSISLLTSQPFAFSLFITANMMAMFCSHLHNLSE
jgi:hypothetical protein